AVKNVLQADVVSVDAQGAVLQAGGLTLRAARDGFEAGARVWIGIRPERLSLDGRGTNVLGGILDDEIYLGDHTDWRVRVGAVLLTGAEGAAAARERKRGDAVSGSFSEDAVLRLEGSRGGAPTA